MHNFYLKPEDWREPYLLAGQEARHLAKVLRIRPGEEVALMDGAGRTGLFRVKALAKHHVELEALEIQNHPRPQNACCLAAAYTKAARRSWLMEKAVEFEAGGIWFWQAERSQIKLAEAPKNNWREQLIAGAKQCANPFLPELRTLPGGAAQLLDEAQKSFPNIILLWEDEAHNRMLQPEMLRQNGPTLFIMGPEGGLTPEEASLFRNAGCQSVSLGNRILRWESAALMCLSLSFWARQLEKFSG